MDILYSAWSHTACINLVSFAYVKKHNHSIFPVNFLSILSGPLTINENHVFLYRLLRAGIAVHLIANR